MQFPAQLFINPFYQQKVIESQDLDLGHIQVPSRLDLERKCPDKFSSFFGCTLFRLRRWCNPRILDFFPTSLYCLPLYLFNLCLLLWGARRENLISLLCPLSMPVSLACFTNRNIHSSKHAKSCAKDVGTNIFRLL